MGWFSGIKENKLRKEFYQVMNSFITQTLKGNFDAINTVATPFIPKAFLDKLVSDIGAVFQYLQKVISKTEKNPSHPVYHFSRIIYK